MSRDNDHLHLRNMAVLQAFGIRHWQNHNLAVAKLRGGQYKSRDTPNHRLSVQSRGGKEFSLEITKISFEFVPIKQSF